MKKSIQLVFALLLNTVVFAQDFEVSPAKMSFALEPGESGTQMITITNHAALPQIFTVTMADFERDSLGKKQYLPPNSSNRSAISMITLNPSTIEINPNETRSIKVNMDVPSDAYGSKWAILYVKGVSEKDPSSAEKNLASGLMVKAQIAIQVYQSPPSNTKYKAIIRDLRDGGKDKTTGEPLLYATIENIGDKIIDAKVYLRISNMETASEMKLKPIKVPVLPGGIRSVELRMPSDLPKGTYSVAAIMDYGSNTNLEGVMTEIVIK